MKVWIIVATSIASGALHSGCKPSAGSGSPGQSQSSPAPQQTRPDDTGADPQWYKGGLYFTQTSRERPQGSTAIKLEDLPLQNCNFMKWPDVAPSGPDVTPQEAASYPSKALYWSFDSKLPRDGTGSSLEIWLAGDAPPGENSSFTFDSQSVGRPARQIVMYSGQASTYTTGVAPSRCVLKILHSKTVTTGEKSVNADTKEPSDVFTLYLSATIGCRLAPSPGAAEADTLVFEANLGCQGRYFKPL